MKYGEDCYGLFWTIFYLGLILGLSACSVGTNSALSTAIAPPSLASATSTVPTGGSGFATPNALPLHTRWIEVSLQEHVLRLHEGEQTIAQYRVATGVGTSPEYTTYPGVFELRRMYRGPIETGPGGTVQSTSMPYSSRYMAYVS